MGSFVALTGETTPMVQQLGQMQASKFDDGHLTVSRDGRATWLRGAAHQQAHHNVNICRRQLGRHGALQPLQYGTGKPYTSD